MKRFSIYSLFTLAIIVIIGAFDIVFTRQDWLSEYRKIFAERVDRLTEESYAASLVFRGAQEENLLVEYLESRRRAGALSSWIFLKEGNVIRASSQLETLKDAKFQLSASGGDIFKIDSQAFYSSEMISPDLQLVLLMNYDEREFLSKEAAISWGVLVKYISGVFTLSLLIFAFLFRDISKLIRRFSKGEITSPEALLDGAETSKSREAAVLGQGMWASRLKAKQLKERGELFANQVLPSLRKEIESGRTPPYDFSCTLVRTDINHFTNIFNSEHREGFTEVINEFFKEVTLCVASYGGYVHQFVGDEILFYFKDEELDNSRTSAVACLRDVNRAAERIHARTPYPFTVKSALSHGEMRFAPFVNGFSIAGPPLIESVRVLSLVTERKENQIFLPGDWSPDLQGLAQLSFREKVLLKGYSDETSIFSLDRFEEPRLSQIDYLRDSADLVPILKESWQGRWSELYMASFALKKMKHYPGSLGVCEALVDVCKQLMQRGQVYGSGQNDFDSARCLANLVVAIPQFFPDLSQVSQSDQRIFEEFFNEAAEVPDARVLANVIQAWGEIFPATVPARLHMNSKVPRVRANAIIALASTDLDLSLAEARKMAVSSRPQDRISGNYALKELERIHSRRDPVRWASLKQVA